MGTLWKKSLVFWNWIIRTCKKFKLCGGVIKTKPSYKCFSNGVPNIEGLFPSTVAFIKKCAGYFFFFKKSVWSEGNRKPRGAPVVWGRPKEVTWKCCLLWGGADWLCRLVLCMHVLVCGNPARAISWCVSISQTNLELSNAFFFPEEMFVLSDINILCISARLWLQVGPPKRLRSNLKKTVCFPPSLFSLSILRKWYICLEYCLSSRFRSIKFWPGMTHLLPMLSQGISWGRGLLQLPETVPFFP